MKILITNDDGYQAKGLDTLVSILRSYGELTIVAPKKPQSGMSMAVTMGFKPITVKKIIDRPGERWWYLDGTPSSCIKFGIDNVFWPDRPDLVVCGINHGSNAATASIYSGTIGAAMEGAVNRLPAIGVSLDTFDEDADFSVVQSMLPGILDKLLSNLVHKYGLFYNINFPNLPETQIKGIKVCNMGRGHWEREYGLYSKFIEESGYRQSKEDLDYIDNVEPGEDTVVMAGDFIDNGDNIYPADHIMLKEGYITITPENIDNTDREEIKRLCDII